MVDSLSNRSAAMLGALQAEMLDGLFQTAIDMSKQVYTAGSGEDRMQVKSDDPGLPEIKKEHAALSKLLKSYGVTEGSTRAADNGLPRQVASSGRQFLHDFLKLMQTFAKDQRARTTPPTETATKDQPQGSTSAKPLNLAPSLPPDMSDYTFTPLSASRVSIQPKTPIRDPLFKRCRITAIVEDGQWRIDLGDPAVIFAPSKRAPAAK